MNPHTTKVGFIGTGVMGASMASHVQQGGYEVHIFTRTKKKALPLMEQGLIWQETPGDLARICDVIVTMVGYPSDVEELYLGTFGLIESARSGTYFIDMTTSSPALARRIYEAAKARGMHALDAPVSGGDIGARNAALTIMAGGDRDAYEAVQPILSRMGKQMLLQGAAGAGQHTKMANQIAIASTMIGVCEALVYAKNAGLDLDNVLQSISAGSAGSWSLSNLAPRIVAENFEPGFYVKHFIKDMGIALDSAAEMNIELPGLALARELYQRIADAGLGDKGTHALYKAWD